jgi:hypothetical protein
MCKLLDINEIIVVNSETEKKLKDNEMNEQRSLLERAQNEMRRFYSI